MTDPIVVPLPPTPPNGLAEIVRQFGDPRSYLGLNSILDPAWEQRYITRIDLPKRLRFERTIINKITAHVAIADHLLATLQQIADAQLWPYLGEYGGGFAYRAQRGSLKLSMHAFGLAWDFDVRNNPLGAKPKMDMRIVDIFEDAGFTWGGRWHRLDGQHFQFARNY